MKEWCQEAVKKWVLLTLAPRIINGLAAGSAEVAHLSFLRGS